MKKLNVFGKWLPIVAKRLLSVAEVRLLSVAEVRLPSVAGVLLLATMMAAPFTASAQVTIGSDALPQATLDIVGSYSNNSEKGKAFRLDDGNQANGKVLTVDGDNAVATWQYPALTILQSIDSQSAPHKSVLIKDYPTSANIFTDTDVYIDLEPGQYMIFTYMPVLLDFSLEASETFSYIIGLVHGGETTCPGTTIVVNGPYTNNGSTFVRLVTMYTMNVSNAARYYVGYAGFTYRNASGTNLTSTHANAATNSVIFGRNGLGGHIYAVPMHQ